MTGSGSQAVSHTAPYGNALRDTRSGFDATRLVDSAVRGGSADRQAAVLVLRRAAGLGVNLIDTAGCCDRFASEELVAEALYPYRGLTIATKGGLVCAGPGGYQPVRHPGYLQRCVEMSLRRLRLEAIDLYQLHTIDPAVPLTDQLGALDDLRAEGKIARIGLSGVTVPEIAEARLIAPVASVQHTYNLANRQAESVVDYCEREGLAFLARSPLAAGQLATGNSLPGGIASEIGATAAQVALAWLLRRSPGIIPISGTRSSEHLAENAAARCIDLADSHFGLLSA